MCHFLTPVGQPEMMHKNFMHRHLRIFVMQHSCMKFYAQIPGHMAAILLIRCAKGVHKVSFLLQYLQVEHDDGKDRKAERQQVSIQQQDTVYCH